MPAPRRCSHSRPPTIPERARDRLGAAAPTGFVPAPTFPLSLTSRSGVPGPMSPRGSPRVRSCRGEGSLGCRNRRIGESREDSVCAGFRGAAGLGPTRRGARGAPARAPIFIEPALTPPQAPDLGRMGGAGLRVRLRLWSRRALGPQMGGPVRGGCPQGQAGHADRDGGQLPSCLHALEHVGHDQVLHSR